MNHRTIQADLTLLGLIATGVIGIFYSFFLTNLALQGDSLIMEACRPGSIFDCQKAFTSGYGKLLGIPISFFAMGYFGWIVYHLFSISLFKGDHGDSWSIKEGQRLFVLPYLLSLVAAFVCVVLLGVSMLVLRRLCPYCLVLDFLVGLMLLLSYGGLQLHGVRAGKGWFGRGIGMGRRFYVQTWKRHGSLGLLIFFSMQTVFSTQGLGAGRSEWRMDSAFKESEGHLAWGEKRLEIKMFTDFECRACRGAARSLAYLQEKYPHQIQIEILHFPLSNRDNRSVPGDLHPLSGLAAKVGIVMRQKGKFQDYYTAMMQEEQMLSEIKIHSIIEKTGEDPKLITRQAGTLEISQILARDIEQGIAMRIDSTPTLIVNGVKFPGGFDSERLEAILLGKETGFAAHDRQKFNILSGDFVKDPIMLLASAPAATATDGGVTAFAQDWIPPLGIPSPVFGLKEQAPASPNPWSGSVPGFYYVNGSVPCSDASNGYPSLPRCTIPSSGLPPGAVVELHGTYDVAHMSPQNIRVTGTASAPIFIRGASSTSRPRIRNCFEVSDSRYLIMENLEFYSQVSCKIQVLLDGNSYLGFRNNEVHGHLNSGGMILYGKATSLSSHMVIYNNRIHDNGDWLNVQQLEDQDIHGIKVGGGMSYLWVVDNEMFHNSGDGIQISAGRWGDAPGLHHIYVGRNHSHDNRQAGFWTKEAFDVIFSQNKAHGARAIEASIGACMGAQYGPERVWFIFNEVYDCEIGFATAATSGPGGDGLGANLFFIGNVIHDIHRAGGVDLANDPWQNGAAFKLTDEGPASKHIFNNTIYGVDRGIVVPRGNGALAISGNIFAATVLDDIYIGSAAGAVPAKSILKSLIFDSSAKIDWGDGVKRNVTGLRAAFPTQCAGCEEINPLFVNSASNDFHLQVDSPAIDKTSTANVYAFFQTVYGLTIAVDMEGRDRPQGNDWDVGAYEFMSAASLDLDQDGLPDAWENQHFGSISDPRADPDDDPDGDGFNNLDEFKAATSPVDKNHRLMIVTEGFVGPDFHITWQSVSGQFYQIEASTDCLNWNLLATIAASTILPATTWIDPSVSSSRKFYRVRIL